MKYHSFSVLKALDLLLFTLLLSVWITHTFTIKLRVWSLFGLYWEFIGHSAMLRSPSTSSKE